MKPSALLALALATWPALAAAELTPPDLMIVGARESVELTSRDRGRMRMYLQQDSLACILGQKRAPEGDVALRLELVKGHAKKPLATSKDSGVRKVAKCLPGILRNVQFPEAAPSWTWEGTLRFGGVRFEAQVITSTGPLEQLPAGALLISNMVLAAIEKPASCLDGQLTSKEEDSAVMSVTLETRADGTLAMKEVKESTVVPAELLDCVRSQLSTLAVPLERPITATLRVALLRPVTGEPKGDVPTLIMKRDK